VPMTFTLDSFVINSGKNITATSIVSLNKEGKISERVATGSGPIDASFKAIDKIVGRQFELEDFQINAVSEGEDALGDARVLLKSDGDKTYLGRGLSTDIIEASIKAYINAINKICYQEQTHEQ